jgi:thymidylate synthase
MKAYEARTPDTQYRELLEKILRHGRKVMPIHGEASYMVVGHQLRFPFENGFPLMTERDLSGKFLQGALAEHVAFLNGARTDAELKAFGCPWWKRWVTGAKCAIFGLPPGDLGPGSYGAAWTNFPTAEGSGFNQITHLMKQLEERPYLRTHFVSPWIPQYTLQHDGLIRKVVVAPCHGWIHVFAFPETKEIQIHHFQRSADVPVGLVFNIAQYAAFGLMVAKLLGYHMTELVYTISDAHLYESQIEKVEELLTREARSFPTMTLRDGPPSIFDFRPDDFVLEEYDPHPAMTIPTPV